MARDAHLSIRVTPEEKAALQAMADDQDLSLGQLARRFLRLRDAEVADYQVAVLPAEPPQNRNREIAWLQANMARLQREIPGHWVILEGEQMVAHGLDYPTIYRAARNQGIVLPFVERITESSGAILMGL